MDQFNKSARETGMGAKMSIGSSIGDIPGNAYASSGFLSEGKPLAKKTSKGQPKKKKKSKKVAPTKGTRDKSMPFTPKKSFSPNPGF